MQADKDKTTYYVPGDRFPVAKNETTPPRAQTTAPRVQTTAPLPISGVVRGQSEGGVIVPHGNRTRVSGRAPVVPVWRVWYNTGAFSKK